MIQFTHLEAFPDVAVDRFAAKVDLFAPNGCWNWTGAKKQGGYGRVRINQIAYGSHRAVWEMFVGPIPDGLLLDHLCRNPSCVNPDHLEPVTVRENLRRGNHYSPQGNRYILAADR